VRLHPHAAGLVAILDPNWRRKIWIGGLLLLIPIVGWPAIVGFRSRFVPRLLGSDVPLLPSFSDEVLPQIRDGLKALAVIFGYQLPLFLAVGFAVAHRGYVPDAGAFWLCAFFVAWPIFSTLSFPVACLSLAIVPEGWLSPLEALAGVTAYTVLVFLIPAGFLQVSLTRRYRSAFAFWRAIPFVARNLSLYLEAWGLSGLMSLAGHLALPLSPWGVVWCYLGIVLLFNELLLHAGLAPPSCWLARAVEDPRFQNEERGFRRELLDAGGNPVAVLDLRLFSVPLPRGFD
jgi:hypothetical protein